MESIMSEEELNRLKLKLEPIVAKWQTTYGTTADDLVADSVSDLWLNAAKGKKIVDPLRWLLVTASNKRKEHFRKTSRCFSHSHRFDVIDYTHSTIAKRFQFSKSPVWQSLTESQQYAVIQVVMHDHPVSEVARELGLKRSTVKSWISRIPRRLAEDAYFQSYREGI